MNGLPGVVEVCVPGTGAARWINHASPRGIPLQWDHTPRSPYSPPYGTAQGVFKRRIGKNCMPIDPDEFVTMRVSSGALDWSGEAAQGVTSEDLDPLEIARARSFLRSRNPESALLTLPDSAFLQGLEAVRNGLVTNTGLLLFGKPDVISEKIPQSQVHYVHQISETKVARNDLWRMSLLSIVEKLEGIFSSPINPEEEIPVGLFRLRIPAFPIAVVREVVLNAVTHRDYSHPGEVLIRHSLHELAVTSPGGFIGGITLKNILRHEPVARNRTLANAFLKLRLVESAGTVAGRYSSRCWNMENGCRATRLTSLTLLFRSLTVHSIMRWPGLLLTGTPMEKILVLMDSWS